MIIPLAVVFSCLLAVTEALINPLEGKAKEREGNANEQQRNNLIGLIEKNVNTHHRLEHLDRQLSTTTIKEQISRAKTISEQSSESTMPTFYTRSDGYLIRYMNKAMPTGVEKARQVPNGGNNNGKAEPVPTQPEEKPPRPTQPMEPQRPTVTMGRPSNTNNNNGQPSAVPTRSSAGNVGRPAKTVSTRATKRANDDDDEGEEEDADQPKKTAKKSPSATQPAQVPIKTSDSWGGDYLLPTRSSKPRWMRNAGEKSSIPNLLVSLSISIVLLLISIF